MKRTQVQPGQEFDRTEFIKKVSQFLESLKPEMTSNKEGLGIICIAIDLKSDNGQMICGGIGTDTNLKHIADMLKDHVDLGKHFKEDRRKNPIDQIMSEALKNMATNN